MTIRGVSWRRYRLPFRSPLHTAHGQSTYREGLILRLSDGDGFTGVGEAVSLPEFGVASSEQIASQVRQIAEELVGRDTIDVERLHDSIAAPFSGALRSAVDTAMLDLQGRRQGVRLAALLGSHVSEDVLVNATVGQPGAALAARLAADAVANGFHTVKLKVGVHQTLADEVNRVTAVREAIGPDVGLRLDANGAWTPGLAIRLLHELAKFDIELVEQPVAAHDLAGLASVRGAVAIPVAADEAATDLVSARRVIDAKAADLLVVKPAVCGGPRIARQIIDLAYQAGLDVIVTSSIESGVGVASALQLAATLPPGALACGLATASMLVDDLILDPLQLTEGRMRLPEGPGLGVVLDEERLAEFATIDWVHAN